MSFLFGQFPICVCLTATANQDNCTFLYPHSQSHHLVFFPHSIQFPSFPQIFLIFFMTLCVYVCVCMYECVQIVYLIYILYMKKHINFSNSFPLHYLFFFTVLFFRTIHPPSELQLVVFKHRCMNIHILLFQYRVYNFIIDNLCIVVVLCHCYF